MGDFVAQWWPYVAALLPTVGLAYLFYVVMKHIVEADRRERFAQRAWEREHGPVPRSGPPRQAPVSPEPRDPGSVTRPDPGA